MENRHSLIEFEIAFRKLMICVICSSFASTVATNNDNRSVVTVSTSLHPLELLEVTEDDVSLDRLLTKTVARYLEKCDLIISFDRTYEGSPMLQTLIQLPQLKQVMSFDTTTEDNLHLISWKTPSECQGLLALVSDPAPLLKLGEEEQSAWDYSAKVIIAGLTKEYLEAFIRTRKAKKTQEIISIVKTTQDGPFRIYMNEFFWGRRRLTQISNWHQDSGELESDLFPNKLSNMRRAELNVITFEWQPSIIYHRDSEDQLVKRYGRDVEVVKTLAEVHNFTYIIIEPHPDELFGKVLPNGSHDGIVGLLATDRGDIGISNTWIVIKRAPYHDFGAPYGADEVCCLARVEPPLPLWQSPALPFQMLTRLVVIAGMILSGPVLYYLARGSNTIGPESPSLCTLPASSLYAYGVHLSQPMGVLPRCSSTQVLVVFLWIYSIILTTGYKSSLIAFLAVAREPESIETIEELYESGLAVLGSQYFKQEFDNSENKYMKGLADRYGVRMRFSDMKDDILAGRAVTISSRMYLEFFVSRTKTYSGRPIFRVMKECTAQHSVSVAFQKHSPLKPEFDITLARMFEAGLVNRWFLESMNIYRKLQERNSDANQITMDRTGEDGTVPLGVEHMQGIFILWTLCSLVSLFLFILETYVF